MAEASAEISRGETIKIKIEQHTLTGGLGSGLNASQWIIFPYFDFDSCGACVWVAGARH